VRHEGGLRDEADHRGEEGVCVGGGAAGLAELLVEKLDGCDAVLERGRVEVGGRCVLGDVRCAQPEDGVGKVVILRMCVSERAIVHTPLLKQIYIAYRKTGTRAGIHSLLGLPDATWPHTATKPRAP
jgi:hypothetical protein